MAKYYRDTKPERNRRFGSHVYEYLENGAVYQVETGFYHGPNYDLPGARSCP
jgi:hypothetical protein